MEREQRLSREMSDFGESLFVPPPLKEETEAKEECEGDYEGDYEVDYEFIGDTTECLASVVEDDTYDTEVRLDHMLNDMFVEDGDVEKEGEDAMDAEVKGMLEDIFQTVGTDEADLEALRALGDREGKEDREREDRGSYLSEIVKSKPPVPKPPKQRSMTDRSPPKVPPKHRPSPPKDPPAPPSKVALLCYLFFVFSPLPGSRGQDRGRGQRCTQKRRESLSQTQERGPAYTEQARTLRYIFHFFLSFLTYAQGRRRALHA